MTQVLPQEWPGLSVNGLVYRYTVDKVPEDDLTVSVTNENAVDGGYILYHTDDWSGLPGTSYQDKLYIPDIGVEYWGDGAIITEGTGTVEDATAIYTYRYDTCFNPINDPECPGYDAAWLAMWEKYKPEEPTIEDPLNDTVLEALPDEVDQEEEEEKEGDGENELEDEERAKALEELGNALANAQAVAAFAQLQALNNIPKFDVYYTSIPGGYYEDVNAYKPATIPDSKRGLRVGLAQQLLMEEMIEEQYKTKENINVQ